MFLGTLSAYRLSDGARIWFADTVPNYNKPSDIFLAAGLVWGLVAPGGGAAIMTFFLSCVFVAGVFGALTVNSRIFYVQAAPATLGLALLWL